MNLNILNSNFNIIEINNESSKLKKFSEHLKSMKEYICMRKDTLKRDYTNISPTFVLNELKQLRNNNFYFCFAIYQKVIMFDKQHDRPTAILFARKGSRNDSYILSLICKHENAEKGFGKMLMDKLIEKAKANNIKYIYVESTSNAKLFYKHFDFDSDSEKKAHTESEKKPELSGYLLEVQKYQIGGSNKSDNKYYFNLYNINGQYQINLIKNNKIGKIILSMHLHPQYMYRSLEIMKIEGKYQEILIRILDNISLKNYIYKTLIHMGDSDNAELYKELNYENKKKKLPWDYYEKIHNDSVYIDRTILSYNLVI